MWDSPDLRLHSVSAARYSRPSWEGCLRKILTASAALWAIAGAVLADPPAPATGAIINRPDWSRKPTNEEMLAYLPATARGRAGLAVTQCTVTVSGALDHCIVRSEDPPGLGFGAAALAMSSTFLMRPMTKDGTPVGGGTVTIPIHFGAGGTANDSGFRLRVLRAATWLATPTAEELRAAFPRKAAGKVALGRTTLRCEIANGGRLGNLPADSGGSAKLRFREGGRVSHQGLSHPDRSELEPVWRSPRRYSVRFRCRQRTAPDLRPGLDAHSRCRRFGEGFSRSRRPGGRQGRVSNTGLHGRP